MRGSSVWNLHHVTLVTPRILRWFLELWEICAPLSEQFNYEYTNIAVNPLILNCVQEYVCGYRVILGINIDHFPNELNQMDFVLERQCSLWVRDLYYVHES